MATRVQLRQRAMRLEALRAEAEQTSAYLAQATSIIDNIPKSAPSPELLAAVPQMVTEFTGARDRLQHVQAELREVQEGMSSLQEELFGASLRASVGHGECLVAANIAARRELGLTLDEKQYRQSAEAASRRVLAEVEQMVEKFKRER